MFFDTIKDELLNESYSDNNVNFDVEDGMNVVIESYINDYTIFEAVLRRDFLEVNGLLTEDGNKNFLKTIWEKILDFIKKAKVKVVEFFKNIRNKLFYNQKKVEKIYKKYEKYFNNNKADELLKDFTINNFKPFYTENSELILKPIFSRDPINSMIGPNGDAKGYTDQDIKELQDYINNAKQIKETIHDKIWIKDKKITQPFKEDKLLKVFIIDIIKRESFDKIEKYCNDKVNKYIKKIKDEEEDVKQKIKYHENRKTEDPDSPATNKFADDQIKKYQNTLKALPLLETLLFKEITIIISEFKELFVASVKLYVAGGKYLQKKLGKNTKNESYIDMDYINAVTEAEIYELELL